MWSLGMIELSSQSACSVSKKPALTGEKQLGTILMVHAGFLVKQQ